MESKLALEESLAALVTQGVVDRAEALARAEHPEELEQLLATTVRRV